MLVARRACGAPTSGWEIRPRQSRQRFTGSFFRARAHGIFRRSSSKLRRLYAARLRIITPPEAPIMTRRLAAALVVAIIPTLVDARAPAQSAGTACANLAALTMPGISVRSATPVAAGAFTPPGGGAGGALAPVRRGGAG